jgi:hypothetical protein
MGGEAQAAHITARPHVLPPIGAFPFDAMPRRLGIGNACLHRAVTYEVERSRSNSNPIWLTASRVCCNSQRTNSCGASQCACYHSAHICVSQMRGSHLPYTSQSSPYAFLPRGFFCRHHVRTSQPEGPHSALESQSGAAGQGDIGKHTGAPKLEVCRVPTVLCAVHLVGGVRCTFSRTRRGERGRLPCVQLWDSTGCMPTGEACDRTDAYTPAHMCKFV